MLKDMKLYRWVLKWKGGLSILRTPAEIVDGVVTTRDGVSVDREFRIGAKKILDILLDEKVELAIL